MSTAAVGGGDWASRLRSTIRGDLGYDSVQDFVASEPGVSLPDLIRTRFGGQFAPIQLAMFLGNAAVQGGWVNWFARDLLVRLIHQHVPSGWGSATSTDFDRAHALAAWLSILKELGVPNLEAFRAGGNWLLHHAPDDWDPTGPDDNVIKEALSSIESP